MRTVKGSNRGAGLALLRTAQQEPNEVPSKEQGDEERDSKHSRNKLLHKKGTPRLSVTLCTTPEDQRK